MNELPFSLERTILIRARRATVFRYFTDSERFAAWWGAGSSIEARPGGAVRIRYPGAVTASGTIVELVQNERIVFTYGYDDPGKPIAPGGSLVTILLRDVPEGTELEFRHDVADEPTRELHVAGWRFQLALFANVVTKEEYAGINERVAAWVEAWAAPDVEQSLGALERACLPGVTFRDPFACLSSVRELAEHIHNARKHMPGLTFAPLGATRACQGTALMEWQATNPSGAVVARGTNVYELAPDGRFASVVGVPGPPA